MEEHKVKIRVTGASGTGKGRILNLIHTKLLDEGYEIRYMDMKEGKYELIIKSKDVKI